ncbi:protein kinase domain-containing protein [Aporhodopirellula aestuarii]|uniref:Protein kinase n=1 Tax=Aporhodopirellula aestuarii TaxID=2950107 RepID=A0ABT0U7K3_9BACT|nr:protein kinase [Aporhodopirellula aestuarii]MCM2372771.1 protein kinase [Aporhodopirellula aestuarii]
MSDTPDGQLYRAVHQRLQKQVALKVLRPRDDGDVVRREQFVSDFRRLCDLAHPNLARTETAGDHEGTLYLVMELVSGLNLRKVVEKIGPLRLPDACQLIGQAAIGLQQLQDSGLKHGHIQLTNLVLTPSGLLKIVGLSEASQTQSPSDFTQDLVGLTQSLCDLIDCPATQIHNELPSSLAKIILQIRSDEDPRSIPTPNELLEVLMPLTVGCDLRKLLSRLDLLFEAGSNDELLHETPGHLNGPVSSTDGTIPPVFRHVNDRWQILTGILMVITFVVIAGMSWSKSGLSPFKSLNSRSSARVALQHTLPETVGTEPKIVTNEWDPSPDTFSAHVIDDSVELADRLMETIEPGRDAFDVEVLATGGSTDFRNLHRRGIVQLPVIMPERYTLHFVVERLEGDGSFGLGFSAGNGRMISLLDHRQDDVWQSGIYFAEGNRNPGIISPYLNQVLIQGLPERIRLEVSPEHVEMVRCLTADKNAAFSEVTHSEAIGSWTRSNAASSSQPSLRMSDGFYPDVFFFHTYKGAFRVSDFRILDSTSDPVQQPFHNGGSNPEAVLAERIVWRGGHVEIITDSGTRTVHQLRELTDDPWLVGVEKCPAAIRLMIGDEELERLAAVKGIRKLDLTDSQITTEGLTVLTGMRSLAILALPRFGIKGTALTKLRDLPALRTLRLNGVAFADEDSATLGQFPQLTSLCLAGCPITDEAVQEIARWLPDLQHLCLPGTRVTGDCLVHLESLRSLTDLQLHETQIDDLAIANLPELPMLQTLTLRNSKVTSAAIDKLKQERPELEIK